MIIVELIDKALETGEVHMSIDLETSGEIIDRIRKQATEIFGLQRFGPGRHSVTGKNRPKTNLIVDCLWVAKISFYSRSAATVAIMHSGKGTRKQGVYLIPLEAEPTEDRKYGGPYPLRPVDLTDWNDPVIDALKEISLTPVGVGPPWVPDYNFSLSVATYSVTSNISLFGPLGEPSLDKLGNALRSTVRTIVDIYDNDEMREYLTRNHDEWEG